MLRHLTPAEELEVMGHPIRQAYELKGCSELEHWLPTAGLQEALGAAEATEA